MSNVVLKRCKQFCCKLTMTGNLGRPVGHVTLKPCVGRINQLGNGLLISLNFVGLATNNVIANGFEENPLDLALGLVNKSSCSLAHLRNEADAPSAYVFQGLTMDEFGRPKLFKHDVVG